MFGCSFGECRGSPETLTLRFFPGPFDCIGKDQTFIVNRLDLCLCASFTQTWLAMLLVWRMSVLFFACLRSHSFYWLNCFFFFCFFSMIFPSSLPIKFPCRRRRCHQLMTLMDCGHAWTKQCEVNSQMFLCTTPQSNRKYSERASWQSRKRCQQEILMKRKTAAIFSYTRRSEGARILLLFTSARWRCIYLILSLFLFLNVSLIVERMSGRIIATVTKRPQHEQNEIIVSIAYIRSWFP